MKIDKRLLRRIERAMSDASQWIAIGEEGADPDDSWFQHNRHFDTTLNDLRRLLDKEPVPPMGSAPKPQGEDHAAPTHKEDK